MADFTLVGNNTTSRLIATNETGIIGQNGSLIVNSGSAIYDTATASSVSIINNGTLHSDYSAINLDGTSISITNTGDATARNNVFSLTGTDANLDTSATLFNHGTISGLFTGADGFYAAGGGNYIFNAGSIFGNGDDAIDVGGTESSRANTIINTGTLTSSSSSTIKGAVSGEGARDIVTNSGIINGQVLTRSGRDEVTNTGEIHGTIDLGEKGDTFDGRGGFTSGKVKGGKGNDTYYVDGNTTDLVEKANEGNDSVYSTGTFSLGNNFEKLFLIGSTDINGHGNGADNDITGNAGANKLRGLGGHDNISGLDGDDALRGQAGRDNLFGGNGDDRLNGDGGNDELMGQGDNDVLRGGSGNDEISGGSEDDKLFGNRGDDALEGGSGDDILLGGAGNDQFYFENGFGQDVIRDFNARSNLEDIVLHDVTAITGWVDLRANHMSQRGNNVLIDAGGDNTILLKGVDLDDLHAGDFIF